MLQSNPFYILGKRKERHAGRIILKGNQQPINGNIAENKDNDQRGQHNGIQLCILPQQSIPAHFLKFLSGGSADFCTAVLSIVQIHLLLIQSNIRTPIELRMSIRQFYTIFLLHYYDILCHKSFLCRKGPFLYKFGRPPPLWQASGNTKSRHKDHCQSPTQSLWQWPLFMPAIIYYFSATTTIISSLWAF
jgi:hypothetical protein